MKTFFGFILDEHPKEITKNPRWSLYALSNDYAHFIKLKEPLHQYKTREYPFLFDAQFDLAEELAKIPIEEFCRACEDGDLPRTVRTIFLLHTPRCGSTLFCQMLQAADEDTVHVLSEPQSFTCVQYFLDNKMWTEEFSTRVVKASMNSYIYAAASQDSKTKILVFKGESVMISLAGIIKAASPDCKLVFLYRKNKDRLLQSVVTMNANSTSFDDRFLGLFYRFPKLAYWLMPQFRLLGGYLLNLSFKIQSDVQYATVHAYYPYMVYQQSRSVLDWQEPISYEEMIALDKESAGELLKSLGIPCKDVRKVLDCYNRDSQNGAIATWGKKTNDRKFLLSDGDRESVEIILKVMGVKVEYE